MKILLTLLGLSLLISGQTVFAPVAARGTVVPMSCTVTGQFFVDIDGTVGQNVYVCNGSTFDLFTGTGDGAGGGISGSSSIDYATIPDGSCADNTFSVTGLAAGDTLSVGLPSGISGGILGMGFASAMDTAKVRLCNFSGAAVDLSSLTYSVTHPAAISSAATKDFGAIADGTCATDTFTLTGAAAGVRVTPGWPAALESGLLGSMFASSADTITIRICNWSGATVDPASGTFSASIL